jgi:hypothetical protein
MTGGIRVAWHYDWLAIDLCSRAQLELHCTTAVQDSDDVGGGGVSNPINRLDTLVPTAGINFQFWNTSILTVGAAAPLERSARSDN